VNRLFDLCRPAFREHGIDFSVSLIVVNARSAVALMEIFYDKADDAETARAKALFENLCELTMSAGYQLYRTNVGCMRHVLEAVPQYQHLVDAMKKAVGPSGILAPGRYGIGVESPRHCEIIDNPVESAAVSPDCPQRSGSF